jgi:hypothetical protein
MEWQPASKTPELWEGADGEQCSYNLLVWLYYGNDPIMDGDAWLGWYEDGRWHVYGLKDIGANEVYAWCEIDDPPEF